MYVYITWKFIKYTIHWDESRMLEKFISDKTNVTKIALLLLVSFTSFNSSQFYFNSQILNELKHKVCPSKTVWGFPFSIPLLVY